MDPKERTTLQNCRNNLIDDIDPSKTFLSILQADRLITEDQRERIQMETTRQDKVVLLLEILPRRGPQAFKKFVKILKKDYVWLKEKLEEELEIQEYSRKIQWEIEEKLRYSSDYIQEKEAINKIICDTVVPIVLKDLRNSPNVYNVALGAPCANVDQKLKVVINEHLAPLLAGVGTRQRLDSAHEEVLINKITEMIRSLKERCLKSMGYEDEEFDTQQSLPSMIDFKLQEYKLESAQYKKDSKKLERSKEKMTTDYQKSKAENVNLKTELKKLKEDAKYQKTEFRKLSQNCQKAKTENEKLKIENKNLKEHLGKAGIDLRISSDIFSSDD